MTPLRHRYERLRPIASGGMGVIYLGIARGAGGFELPVAIKVMHREMTADPNLVAMFFDEARLAARIRHVNVVSTLDIVEDAEAGLCLVMEFVDGHSLSTILRELRGHGVHVPLGIGLRIVLDALAGLHAAHELQGPDGALLGLVHRDVSPHNILVSFDGAIKLTDFGVARAEQRLAWTRVGQLKGKLSYMAVEQLQGGAIDRRTDLFAMGIVLWELLTGDRLFGGEHEAAVAYAISQGATRAPHEVNPQVPYALSMACMRALRGAIDERYPTAVAFAEALEAAAGGAGVAIASSREVAALCQKIQSGPSVPATSGVTVSALSSLSSRRRREIVQQRSALQLAGREPALAGAAFFQDTVTEPLMPASSQRSTAGLTIGTRSHEQPPVQSSVPPSGQMGWEANPLVVNSATPMTGIAYLRESTASAPPDGTKPPAKGWRGWVPLVGALGFTVAIVLWFAGLRPRRHFQMPVARSGIEQLASAVTPPPAVERPVDPRPAASSEPAPEARSSSPSSSSRPPPTSASSAPRRPPRGAPRRVVRPAPRRPPARPPSAAPAATTPSAPKAFRPDEL